MLNKVIDGCLGYMEVVLGRYGVVFSKKYNSDLDMISEYSSSIQVRSLFKDGDSGLISSGDITSLGDKKYVLCLYNYSPLRRYGMKMNNVNGEVVFGGHGGRGSLSAVGDRFGGSSNFASYESVLGDSDGETGEVRDVVFGIFGLTFKFLCSDSNKINDIQFIHCKSFQSNGKFDLVLDIDGGSHTFEYKMDFGEIDSVGHVDYSRFGSLQHLTFSVEVVGPIFSFYKSGVGFIDKVKVDMGIV